MATLASDNFLSVSQRFFSPEILQKISREINQPVEQTKVGLKSVIPTLFMGIFNKASTKEGAESLLNLANKDVPNNVENFEEIKPAGNDVLNGIFGSNLNNVVSKLGVTTGMNTGSITKMLGMVAPMVMGVIGSKVKNEKMSASGLMSFLSQQKSSLSGLLAAGISGVPGMTEIKEKLPSKTGWMKIVLAIILIGGAAWSINMILNRSEKHVVEKTMTAPVAATPEIGSVESISMLDAFMSSSAVGATRRFRFEQLKFRTGSTMLATGTAAEINQVAASMKTYPTSTLRIEGFTDNIGSAQNNMLLSNQRALAVRKQLIDKGIPASRIQARGMGASNPIGNNDTETGRAANRRIEFIVRR